MEKNRKDIDGLILSFLERTIASEDLQYLRQWVSESQENKTYFKNFEDIWLLSNVSKPDKQYHKEDAYQRFKRRTNQSKTAKKNYILKNFISYAACIVVVFTAGYFLKWGVDNAKTPEILVYIAEAPRRAKAKLELPDGSVVWLNAASKLTYNNLFGVSNRDLQLEGEGYFEINRNIDLPLVVTSGNTAVEVLGTKFNVRNYLEDDEMRVSLLEGSVSFSEIRYNKPIILKPKEFIICNKKSGILTLKDMDTEYMNAWIYDDVFLNEEKLGNIAKILERAFDINIIFQSDDLKSLTFYGDITIESDNIIQIMEVMSATNKFRYQYDLQKKSVEIFH